MDTVLTTLVSGLLAMFGGWLGARVALNRFKEERSYERRVEWHLAALRALHDLERAQSAVPVRSPAHAQAREVVHRFVAEATAFMTPDGCRWMDVADMVLQGVERETDELLQAAAESGPILAALAKEREQTRYMTAAVTRGISRLMPPEEEFGWRGRMKARLSTLRGGLGMARRRQAPNR